MGAHPDQSSGGAEEALPFDLLLCAVGRRAWVTGSGLDALGIPLTPAGKDRILGACVVGEHAGELLAELTLAMKHGLGLERILGTVHRYPTWSEAAKYAAGNWKRAHAPQTALRWLARFHGWRRGSE